MWSAPVVILLPLFKCLAGVAQCTKQRFIGAFILQLAIEALDKADMSGLSERDVMPVDASILNPFEDRHSGELSTVI